MKYQLDTHVWIWWMARPEKLSYRARDILSERINYSELLLSAISMWEFCKLVEKGRLKVSCSTREWLGEALDMPGLRLVPLTPSIACDSTSLPGNPGNDPADQIITATARVENATLLTADVKLLEYPHVRTLW